MFMLFKKDVYVFGIHSGFDDNRFFMYFEDVDICRRVNMNGYSCTLASHKVTVQRMPTKEQVAKFELFYMAYTFAMFRYFSGL